MTHNKVKSKILYSVAHDGDGTMEVRFKCRACDGTGESPRPKVGESRHCDNCNGKGHAGTYKGTGIPHHVFQEIVASDHPGKMFKRLIQPNPAYKMERQPE